MNKWFIPLMAIIVFGCSRNATTENMYMTTDSVIYAHDFPIKYQLQEPSEFSQEIIGIKSFCILDTVLAFTLKGTDQVVDFFSTGGDELGRFMSIGDGPQDLIEHPNFNTNADFYKEKGRRYVLFYDSQKGRLLDMDVDSSLLEKSLCIKEVMSDLSNSLFTIKKGGGDTYFCKELNDDATNQIRYLLKNGKRKETKILAKLNQANVPEGEDFNILSALTKIHGDKVVEAPIGLNYMNLYSIEDSFAVTICMDKELSNINEIIKQNEAERLYTFANVQVYDSFWGVVYIGEEEKTYQLSRKKKPAIYLFDWEGKPLAEIKLNRHITSFDIDFNHGELYTLDVHTDEFLKYDIRNLLYELSKAN